MLRIVHLTLRLGTRLVLDDVCLSLQAGGLTLVTGPNGAGKSTLLRCLAGVDRFDTGVITVDGETMEPGSPVWRRRVALVPDDNALLPELTAREHLELGCVLAALPPSAHSERCDNLVRLFGLEDHAARRTDELSFGYRKRLAIALSLVQPADLYLFDEPLVGLDAESLDLFVGVVDLLRYRHRTVVVASHIAAPLATMADRRVLLREGRLEPEEPTTSPPRLAPEGLPWLA